MKEKGITLIALIITIIILLILASVAIAILTGNNGLLERVEDAKIQTEIAEIKERIKIDILGEQAGNEGNISNATLKKILEKYGTLSEEHKLIDKTLTTAKGNYEIKVADIWKGTTKVANKPNISGFNKSTTYYVTWDLTSSPYQISEGTNLNTTAPSNWYDYTAGQNQWANVKTTGGGNDCYWVWIPRYAYKVPTKSSTAESIEIKFLDNVTNVPIGEKEAITNTMPTPGEWVVHPAFTKEGNGGFGELTGIWVAKFEASSNSLSVVENPTASQLEIDGGSDTDTDLKVRVRPNVTSWRNITGGNIFTVCQSLTTSGNSLEGTRNIDSHMMKNTEWGAVAYLSRSVYGKNSAVWNNPYYNNTTNYSPITGLSGSSQDASQTTLDNTYKYNENGGENASTTGNVYGVYDMAGGAWENVAGILSYMKSNKPYYDFSNINTKYYDSYENYDNTKYGDAVYETSTSTDEKIISWDFDYSTFLHWSHPIFIRGGASNNGNSTGIFAFVDDVGDTKVSRSFRPCLISP